MIARSFLDIIPNSPAIQKLSKYHSLEQRPKKLLEQISDVIRLKHYSYKTEKSYINWIKRYILFHGKRHPKEIGGAEIETRLWRWVSFLNSTYDFSRVSGVLSANQLRERRIRSIKAKISDLVLGFLGNTVSSQIP